MGAANCNTHPYHILAQNWNVPASPQPPVLQATRLSSVHAAMLSKLAMSQKEHSETVDPAEHADDTNNHEGTAAEPPAAAQDGPRPQEKNEASSKSDGSASNGVTILSQLLGRQQSDMDLEITRLKAERDAMKQQKKKVAHDLRNTERKRARLKNRAKLMSTNDLLEVYAMRCREKEKREEPKAKTAPRGPVVPAAAGVSKK